MLPLIGSVQRSFFILYIQNKRLIILVSTRVNEIKHAMINRISFKITQTQKLTGHVMWEKRVIDSEMQSTKKTD